MNYRERYIIRWTKFDGSEGTFGPWETEEDAAVTMNMIIKGHNHVRDIGRAHLVRLTEVTRQTFATAKERP